MLIKSEPANTHSCQQEVDELVGYLYLLIEELQQKYCQEELTKFIDNLDEEEIAVEFNDRIPF